MIKGMKASGFDSLRVPVAWTNAMEYEKGDYTINEAYLDRVEEIINYALDNDMYVIINDHWDGSWWGMFGSSEQSDVDKAFEMYKSMWTQIANRYKNTLTDLYLRVQTKSLVTDSMTQTFAKTQARFQKPSAMKWPTR